MGLDVGRIKLQCFTVCFCPFERTCQLPKQNAAIAAESCILRRGGDGAIETSAGCIEIAALVREAGEEVPGVGMARIFLYDLGADEFGLGQVARLPQVAGERESVILGAYRDFSAREEKEDRPRDVPRAASLLLG